MNNNYTILNRKISLVMRVFILNIIILIIFVIWGINNLYYQNFIQFHSKILYFDSFYYMEVLVPVKEVNTITKQSQIIIDSNKYNYEIYKVVPDVEYINNINYQKVYLKIFNLDEFFLVNGYELDVKVLKEKKKIIEMFKE